MLLIFTIILLLAYFILFEYYAKGWQRSGDAHPTNSNNQTFVSVIIAARNEEQNIPPLLQSLNLQDYPFDFFEVIIVDDHSTDKTKEAILSSVNSNLRYILQDQGVISKKKAIEKGVSHSKGELILTTDADCILPASWISSMAGNYQSSRASFIAAPVKFSYQDNLIQKFQALDFMMLQAITASGIALKLHYMCNGANLGFSRNSFFEVDGYSGIDQIATGDDMLLMHKIRRKYPEGISYFQEKKALVTTTPQKSWKDFFQQRKRWASKTFVYDDCRIIALLVMVYLFNLWFFVLLVSVFFEPSNFLWMVLYVLVKALIENRYLSAVAKFYGEEKLLKYLFLYQPIHIFYTVFVGALSQGGIYEWKGRKTK